MISSKTLGEAFAEKLAEASGKAEADKAVKEFAAFVVSEGRTGSVPRIIAAFTKKWNELKNEVDIKVEYAGEKPDFPHKIHGKNTSVSYKQNDALIGGMTASIGDYLIDASIQGRINKIKNITR